MAAAADDDLRLRRVRSQGETRGGEGAAQNSAHQSAAVIVFIDFPPAWTRPGYPTSLALRRAYS
jgi:hypothetical protein